MSAAAAAPYEVSPPTQGEDIEGRPEIVTNDRELHELAEASVEALHLLNEREATPQIFMQGPNIVRVFTCTDGRGLIQRVGPEALTGYLSQAASYVKLMQHGPRRVFPPREIATYIVKTKALHTFPELRGLTGVPTLRPDGTVLDTAGYDQATGLVYRPMNGLTVPAIPEQPSPEQVKEAVALLGLPLQDFPFEDQASRAAAWAILLTPVIRPAIQGGVPMALIDAPAPGSGKGLLAKVATIIATGREHAGMITQAETEAEWKKSLTALLSTGTPVILIDNLEGTLDSKHLAAALTATEWSDRLLGHTEIIEVPQQATWMATANNVVIGGDLARRTYLCRIDAGVEHPEDRTGFAIPDLAEWTLEHRGELVGAALTLARAWFVARKPVPENLPAGQDNFAGWARMLGGILHLAGIVGFLANKEQARVADSYLQELAGFLRTWFQIYGDQELRIGDALKDVRLLQAVPERFDAEDRRLGQKLGLAFRRFRGRPLNGYRLERVTSNHRGAGARWQVFCLGEQPEPLEPEKPPAL